jgi:hypothetical protein
MNKTVNIQSSQYVHGQCLAVWMGRASRRSGTVGSIF